MNQPSKSNPYSPPAASLHEPLQTPELSLTEPQKQPMSHGWHWLVAGFDYFMLSPLNWILGGLIYFALIFLLSFIPPGSLLITLVNPVFIGGWMLGCLALDRSQPLRADHLFDGFRDHFGQLALLGLFYLLGTTLITLLALAVAAVLAGGIEAMFATATGGINTESQMGIAVLVIALIWLLLYLILLMATWFAPALVCMHQISAVQAMKLSLQGCLRNLLPLLWYVLILLVLAVLATLPFFLGWLVLGPTAMASVYAAYREIYTQSETFSAAP